MTRLDRDGPDPRDLLRVLRRRGWILLVCVLVIPAAAYLYSQQLDAVYESSVLIKPQPPACPIAQQLPDVSEPRVLIKPQPTAPYASLREGDTAAPTQSEAAVARFA